MNARQRFKADLERYFAHFPQRPSLFRRIVFVLRNETVWAIWLYRFGQFLREDAPGPVRILCAAPYRIAEMWIGQHVGIHLKPICQIGPGLYIGHYGGIWISGLARLGANCSISQGVTIGVAHNRASGKAPILGDRVWIGPNAVITGPVKIGDGALIGANSLVASSIPENGVAVGVPARIISYSGSAKLITLPGKHDPQSGS